MHVHIMKCLLNITKSWTINYRIIVTLKKLLDKESLKIPKE